MAIAVEEKQNVKIDEFQKIKVRNNFMYSFIKRTFDIVSSGIALILLFIPLGIICLLKAIEDFKTPYWKLDIKEANDKTPKKYSYWNKEGKKYEIRLVPDVEKIKKNKHKWISPIYKSIRIGKNGRPFKFYKLRSMCHHAELMKQELIDYGFNEVDEPMFKMTYDPRITKLGKFLRKTSIDELPQLINIFLGSMSVIGPRSPIDTEYENFSDYAKQKCLVKGGLLCLWQIQHNRNEIQFDDWIKLDLEYIQKRSLWLDIKILFKGAWMVLFDRTGR